MTPARGLSFFALFVAFVACGGKTKTEPDNAGGNGGAGATTGSGTGGANGEVCGSTVCSPGFVCCSPSCGFCVEAGSPCPAIGCTTTTTGPGGSTVSGPGGPTTTTAASSTGAGGATTSTTTGAGGASGCGTVEDCRSKLISFCPFPGDCECTNCLCEAQACFNDPGCRAIYACSRQKACTDQADCLNKCGPVIMANPSSIPRVVTLATCAGRVPCSTPCSAPFADAGVACTPPPPKGAGRCTVLGSPNEQVCGRECTDDSMNGYVSKCSNLTRGCDCYYNLEKLCSCTYSIAPGCRDCCPPWGP